MKEHEIRNLAAGLVEKVQRNAGEHFNGDERAVMEVALRELSRKLAMSCRDDDEPTTENPV